MQARDEDEVLNDFLRFYNFEVLEDGSWQAGCFNIRWRGEKPVVTVSPRPHPLKLWEMLVEKLRDEGVLLDGTAGSD